METTLLLYNERQDSNGFKVLASHLYRHICFIDLSLQAAGNANFLLFTFGFRVSLRQI
jgi:hypothetical protein